MKYKKCNPVVMTILTVAIVLFPFAACNQVKESNIVRATAKPATTNHTATKYSIVTACVGTPQKTFAISITTTAHPTATPKSIVTPTPTSTKVPTSTKAPTPTKTPTPTKAPTPTKMSTPTKTPTLASTQTPILIPIPTTTPMTTPLPQEVYQTLLYEGKTYHVLMGRNGNPYLIQDYSTLPAILRAYAYPTFDANAVIRDIYTYAKTKGFTNFGYAQDVMTEEIANRCSWDSPAFYTYPGDSFYTADFTEIDGILADREFYPTMVDFYAAMNMDCLCVWIRAYHDSSYREEDSYADGLYNGTYTEEYAMYFMYGWPLEVPNYQW